MSDDKKIVCKICGREFAKNNGLAFHLNKVHNMQPEDYYSEYINEQNHCPICGEETEFIDLAHGYKEYCSFRCEQTAKGVDVEGEFYKKKHHCLICGEEVRKINQHLKEIHDTTTKEYYDKYYKTESEGFCAACGRATKFNLKDFCYHGHCSNACVGKSAQTKAKKKATSLKNYNCEHPQQSKQVRDQVRATCLKKYNVENPSQCEEIKAKKRATNLEHWGCENVFQNDFIKEKSKQTNLERYGVENISSSELTKEKKRQRYLDHFGYDHPAKVPEIKEKTKQTCLERYGGHPFNDPGVKEKALRTSLAKYGTNWPSQSEQVKEKIKNTNLERYGCESALSSKEVQEKIKQTNLERYGGSPFNNPGIREKLHQTTLALYGVDHIFQDHDVKEKIKQTNKEKYGYPSAMKNSDVKAKVAKNRTENKTWNTSSQEGEVYSRLIELFGEDDVVRQYKEERYNYRCDFYIKSRDLFIEFNAYHSHFGHWFDGDNEEDARKLKQLEDSTDSYDNGSAANWLRDAKKRETARQNNLNYVVFWRKEDLDLWVSLGCPDGKDYIKEYSWLPVRKTLDPFCEFPKKLSPGTSICRAVAKAANGDSLFYRECEMWEENPPHGGTFLQPWLYANRLKYMDSHKNPEEITDAELIRGFTISGTIRGYSRYDVKPMKELLTEYGVKSVYDPCAGWGERLAICGALGISYEGVDINEKVVNGHNKIISHYKLGKNYSSTCGDSAKYTPKGSPDAVFTCPPYLAKEIYTDKGAENLPPEEFEGWWNEVCSNFPDSVQHVFVHIDEETKPHIITATEANGWKLVDDRYFSKKNASHFNRGKGGEIKKKNWESVLIFKR